MALVNKDFLFLVSPAMAGDDIRVRVALWAEEYRETGPVCMTSGTSGVLSQLGVTIEIELLSDIKCSRRVSFFLLFLLYLLGKDLFFRDFLTHGRCGTGPFRLSQSVLFSFSLKRKKCRC